VGFVVVVVMVTVVTSLGGCGFWPIQCVDKMERELLLRMMLLARLFFWERLPGPAFSARTRRWKIDIFN
jgi:hypothetical protein